MAKIRKIIVVIRNEMVMIVEDEIQNMGLSSKFFSFLSKLNSK